MSHRVSVDFSGAEFLRSRGLDRGGKVQTFFTNEVMVKSLPYLPFDEGFLTNSAHMTDNNSAIVYDTPYARRLWYNPQFNFQGAPMRGAEWTIRAWNDHKDEILSATQRYIDSLGG